PDETLLAGVRSVRAAARFPVLGGVGVLLGGAGAYRRGPAHRVTGTGLPPDETLDAGVGTVGQWLGVCRDRNDRAGEDGQRRRGRCQQRRWCGGHGSPPFTPWTGRHGRTPRAL